MDERFEKLTKAMNMWTAQFEERMKDLIVAKANGPPPLPGFAATVEERPVEKAKGIDPWAQARSDAAVTGAAGTTAPQEPAAGPGGGAAAQLRPPSP